VIAALSYHWESPNWRLTRSQASVVVKGVVFVTQSFAVQQEIAALQASVPSHEVPTLAL
jgi:hypothetical protein